MDRSTLQAKLKGGEILATDLVWKEGMAEWTAAGEVDELKSEPSTPNAPSEGVGQSIDQPASSGTVQGQAPATTAPQQPAMAPSSVGAPTSGLAIASMVCGIVGLMFCYVHALVALPAVICGHMALKQIDKSLTPIGGRGMAVAGLVTGYIGLLFQVLWIVFFAFAIMSGMGGP